MAEIISSRYFETDSANVDDPAILWSVSNIKEEFLLLHVCLCNNSARLIFLLQQTSLKIQLISVKNKLPTVGHPNSPSHRRFLKVSFIQMSSLVLAVFMALLQLAFQGEDCGS